VRLSSPPPTQLVLSCSGLAPLPPASASLHTTPLPLQQALPPEVGGKREQPWLFTPGPALCCCRTDSTQVVGGTEGASTAGSLHPTPHLQREQPRVGGALRISFLFRSLQHPRSCFPNLDNAFYPANMGSTLRTPGWENPPHPGVGLETTGEYLCTGIVQVWKRGPAAEQHSASRPPRRGTMSQTRGSAPTWGGHRLGKTTTPKNQVMEQKATRSPSAVAGASPNGPPQGARTRTQWASPHLLGGGLPPPRCVCWSAERCRAPPGRAHSHARRGVNNGGSDWSRTLSPRPWSKSPAAQGVGVGVAEDAREELRKDKRGSPHRVALHTGWPPRPALRGGGKGRPERPGFTSVREASSGDPSAAPWPASTLLPRPPRGLGYRRLRRGPRRVLRGAGQVGLAARAVRRHLPAVADPNASSERRRLGLSPLPARAALTRC
jgi:hypothetical protein